MTEHSFVLVPFPNPDPPKIKITGRIARKKNTLSVQYLLSGKMDNILLPEPVTHPGRKNDLWLTTCFEYFLSLPEQPQYWEFNLSPSGEWNIFCMDAYRRVGFRQEDRIRNLNLEISKHAGCVRMDAVVDLDPLFESEMQIQAGITGVIQTREGSQSYWALTHPGPQADFHMRESFIIYL